MYLIISLLLILVGAGVLCAVKWQAWFVNQPEQDYVVAQRPNNIVLTMGQDAQHQRIVSWRADTAISRSCLRLVHARHLDTVNIAADSALIYSQAGVAAYYQARLDNLQEGQYSYQCVSGDRQSEWHNFRISDLDTTTLLFFGDIEDKKGTPSRLMMQKALSRNANVDAVCYTGNILEHPMDKYWQVWQRSLEGRQSMVPQIAVAGSNEYRKGLMRKIDNRWTHVFGIPQNAPYRFLGTSTYFIDFPTARLIMLDTHALNFLSDYTIMQTWLSRLLISDPDKWKIVIMHQPVHYAATGRYHPALYLAFHEVLKDADLVFSGSDHNYVRRQEMPQYIILNSSDRNLEIRKDINQDPLVACYDEKMKGYCSVSLTYDSLHLYTYDIVHDRIIDQLSLGR